MAAPSVGTEQRFKVWYARLQALWKLLEFIKTRNVEPVEDAVNRTATISRLLEQLHKIGSKQYSFFQHGFDPGHHLILQPDKNISYSHALGRTLEQIANDLVVIQRAQEQRSVSLTGNQTRTIARTLTVADKLAYIVLAMLRGHFVFEEQTTVLTYLHKSPNVRVLPYAPVVVIGIPLTVVGVRQRSNDVASDESSRAEGVARDLLAIPHEFAHHLYWNGRLSVDGQTKSLRILLQEHMQDQPKWLRLWIEEIFADVVTALVAGPVAALSFQDLLLEARNHEMLLDNGQHPIPVLRPYIYTETLRHIPGIQHAPDKLEARWEQKLQEHNILETGRTTPKQMVLFPWTNSGDLPNSTESYLLASPLAMLQTVIHQILTLLPPSVIQSSGLPMWSTDVSADLNLANEEDVETFYAAFEEAGIQHLLARLDELCGDRSPEEVLNPDWEEAKWDELLDRHELFADIGELAQQDVPEQWLEHLRTWDATDTLPEPLELPPMIWQRILDFAGWTTEGPENQPAEK